MYLHFFFTFTLHLHLYLLIYIYIYIYILNLHLHLHYIYIYIYITFKFTLHLHLYYYFSCIFTKRNLAQYPHRSALQAPYFAWAEIWWIAMLLACNLQKCWAFNFLIGFIFGSRRREALWGKNKRPPPLPQSPQWENDVKT